MRLVLRSGNSAKVTQSFCHDAHEDLLMFDKSSPDRHQSDAERLSWASIAELPAIATKSAAPVNCSRSRGGVQAAVVAVMLVVAVGAGTRRVCCKRLRVRLSSSEPALCSFSGISERGCSCSTCGHGAAATDLR